tara:strand:- start:21 stop:512 length:492 start_codon:yes stop_codon:yes gene_type:complete
MKMIKIYCIEDVNGLKYIGSTVQPLKERLWGHKSKNNECSSYKLDLYNSFIYTIEECNQDDKKEREQYWIDNTDCVNMYNTTFDKKEYHKQWHIDNRDKNNENNKQWRIDNRDKKMEYNKQYHTDNRDKINENATQRYHYQNSWGGDKRSNNNLLEIDIDIFN